MSRRRQLAHALCGVWISGCNGILDIHEPSYAIVIDAGTLDAAPDARTQSQMDMLDEDAGIESTLPLTPFARAAWPMPNPQLADAGNPQSYRAGGGVVIDEVTGLAWQQIVPADSMTWQQATDYCRTLTIGGNGSFRLPSRIELLSIFDPTRPSPTLDSVAFPGTPPAVFWTASPFVTEAASAWTVSFGFSPSLVQASEVIERLRVRCVRPEKAEAETGEASKLEVDEGHVIDSATKLLWQRHTDDTARTWKDAGKYCAQLDTDDLSWRLPTIKELATLVDERHATPAIDAAFAVTSSDYYWSSSPAMSFRESAWTVSFVLGFDGLFNVESLHPVRCVH